jgi:hypothetical protein
MSEFVKKHDVAFVYSSKDRLELTQQTIAAVDACSGFDVLWLDGSKDPAARDFVHAYQPKNMHFADRQLDVGGGPDAVIIKGLTTLMREGYQLCGLLENDILLEPEWFPALLRMFSRGKALGMNVGAVSLRTFESRVLAYGPDYALMWDIGAAMILLTRPATEIILATYAMTDSMRLARFYHRHFDVNLQDRWEIWRDQTNIKLTCDFNYCPQLYRHNLASIGSVPSMARNIDADFEAVHRTRYATQSKPSPEFDRIVRKLRDASAAF